MNVIVLVCVLLLLGIITGAVTKKPRIYRVCASLLSFAVLFVVLVIWMIAADFPILRELFGTASLWLPLVVCGGLFLSSLLLIWRPFPARPRRLMLLALAVAIVVTTGSVAGVQAYENSFIEIRDLDMEISLERYMPFGNTYLNYEDANYGTTLVKTLAAPATLTLVDNLPRLDGATALYPLYSAFVRATYPEGDYFPYNNLEGFIPEWMTDAEAAALSESDFTPVICSQTSGALANLYRGLVEVAFVMDVSALQAAEAEAMGLELQLTPIGKEAFVFLVNSNNSVANVTQDDIRGIYSGAIVNWRGVGGANDKIEAYQRPEGSGSQTALQKIMGTTPIMTPKDEQVYSFMGGLYNAVANYKNYKNAIGYSFRFYIETMLNDTELQKVRLLSIDGVPPTPESIAAGTYPYGGDFYAVTVRNRVPGDEAEKARQENAQKLIDWILSAQGQELVEKTGYIKYRG